MPEDVSQNAVPAAPEVQPEPAAPEATATEPAPTGDLSQLPEWVRAELTKVRNEAANYRTKLREAEPLAQKARELEEAQKTEVQKLAEARTAAEARAEAAVSEALRLRIAVRHGIAEADFDLLGSGTEEQIEARAKRIAELATASAPSTTTTPPPSDRPVEQLRPGATPTDVPLGQQDSYPAHWLPGRTE
ncbi:hypothetical protein [Nakamurella lactea]|uniref:hypothetical protein n=1 Tax=Nakamurella lactea TaxID=459515 RepID=UPI0004129316|nr:hypothetical protein [Nakamurella lactea]